MLRIKEFCLTTFFILFFNVFEAISQHNYQSPCPNLFYYEPTSEDPDTRWYGVITLLSDADLQGVYLRIIFDKESKQLGNWFGEVDTRDNVQYLVKNRQYRLKAYTPQLVRFYVTYNKGETPPKLLSFRLNARDVCPVGGISTTTTTTPAAVFPNRFQGGTTESTALGYQTSRPLSNQINAPVCGTVPQKAKPLILGGYEIIEGEFPWHVALYQTENRLSLTLTCGGNLITRTHVLTAAHCITRKYSKQLIDLGRIQVFLGTSNLIRFNPGVQVRAAIDAKVHPDYDPTILRNDVAVLVLSSPVKITDFVRTICLWSEDTSIHKMYGRVGSVVGWRHDNNELIPDKLLGASMPIVSKEDCIFSKPEFFSKIIFEKNYCAGFLNGTSVCSGDSGGGMVFPKQGQAGDPIVWQLRGLVSASAVNDVGQCNPKNYIVFTDVAQYLRWIKDVVLSTKVKED